MARLVFKKDGGAGRALELSEGTNRVGRGFANDLRVPELSISTSHCEVTVSEAGVWVVDLGSTNGSFIEGRPIQQEMLGPGQTLQLGDVQFVLETNRHSHGVEPAVSIPQLSVPAVAVQPHFSDGSMACLLHPEIAVEFECTHCHFAFCQECVRTVGIAGGKSLFFCPECHGKCEPLETPRPANSISDQIRSVFTRLVEALKLSRKR